MPLLEVKDLQVRVEEREILHGLSLTVNKGEVHAIMGPNGSGKSTLSHVIAGKPGYEVTGGQILFKGEDLLEMEPDERAAYLDASFEYLMCSSIRDGRPWALLHATAIQSPGYEVDRAGSILATQVQLCARAYAQAIWAYATWMSHDSLDELQSSLEFGYDSLALPDEAAARFWRRKPARRTRAAAALAAS